MPARTPFDLSITAEAGRHYIPFLRTGLGRAHGILKPGLRELSLALVSSRTMSSLHWRYLGIRGPTDVLTFELDHDRRGRVVAGEVIVCVSNASQAARQRRIPLRHELLLYALHGMLHLCGFDDRTDPQFEAMHRREDQILSELGIGEVFSRPRAAARPRRRAKKGKAR